MTNNNNNDFSVLNLAQDMADTEDLDIAEFFKNHPVSGNVKREAEAKQDKDPIAAEVEEAAIVDDAPPAEEPPKKKKRNWTPSAEVMADLPELNHSPAIYTKEELQQGEESEGLRSIADDNAKQDARNAMDELQRKLSAIEDAKARHGILNFQIPEGPWHVKIHNAAIDMDYAQAQRNLDVLFDEIERDFPEFIRDWLPGYGPNKENKVIPLPMPPEAGDSFDPDEEDVTIPDEIVVDEDKVSIRIDKTNVPQVAWSPEEMDKIRRARTVELNIVEGDDLVFSEIEDVAPSAMDQVLSQYIRKANDVESALPASKYRATFVGLSYPEVLDLDNSNEMNTLDGERAKWTIAFNHIRNQSIGPWEEYKWYIDKETNQKVKIDIDAPIPEGYTQDDIHVVTKFDDFLMKTSWIDLEFILWKILCATAMEQEIVTVECHANVKGKRCNHSYDWIYSPNELLDISTVNPGVLEEMKKTSEVTGPEVMANYRTAFLHGRNTAELPHAKFKILAGHISAYEYLDHIFNDVTRLNEMDEDDPLLMTTSLHYTTLTCLKGFLLPKPNGGWYRITGSDNIVRILHDLDEVDWQVCTELVRMIIEPYQFEFSIRDLHCPKCHNKSKLNIRSIQRLLFIVARSLSSVQVELKRI